MTKLDKPLRREVEIAARHYTLVLDQHGLKLKQKGHRHGLELRWTSLVNRLDGVPDAMLTSQT